MRERMCLVLIAMVAFGKTDLLHAPDTLPALTAAVHNYADMPGDVLTDAEAEASRIFRHAGVRLLWVGSFASQAPVRVHILSGPMTAAHANATRREWVGDDRLRNGRGSV